VCDTEKNKKEMARKAITQSRSPGAKGDDADEGEKMRIDKIGRG
jgi:hypothetical protein